MSRSAWKVPYVSPLFFSNHFRKSSKSMFITWNRNSIISKALIGRVFTVHNGVWLLKVTVESNMVGFKLGSFSFTKRIGFEIHDPDKKKKKK